MKSMLVLIGGGPRDRVVFQTALAAARPLSAHMDCLHVHNTLGLATRDTAGETNPRRRVETRILQTQAEMLSKASKIAADNVRQLCARSTITLLGRRPDSNPPSGTTAVTASFREETDLEPDSLADLARDNDLVVMGRAKQTQGLPQNTLERLILRCGRPMLLAGTDPPEQLDTIMVCWKGSDHSARVVGAASPLLSRAKRVVFTAVGKPDAEESEALDLVAQQFRRRDLQTDVRIIPPDGRKISDLLVAAAEACAADLMVMGAYGRARALEFLFGSCTEAVMTQSNKPILLLHWSPRQARVAPS
jgi:nucleotide-binding universal stress UspA family protein